MLKDDDNGDEDLYWIIDCNKLVWFCDIGEQFTTSKSKKKPKTSTEVFICNTYEMLKSPVNSRT